MRMVQYSRLRPDIIRAETNILRVEACIWRKKGCNGSGVSWSEATHRAQWLRLARLETTASPASEMKSSEVFVAGIDGSSL